MTLSLRTSLMKKVYPFQVLALIWFGFLGAGGGFCKKKVTIDKNVSFTDYASRIQLPDCSKLAIN